MKYVSFVILYQYFGYMILKMVTIALVFSFSFRIFHSKINKISFFVVKVLVGRGQPDKSPVSDREPGGGMGRGADGVEGKRGVLVLAGDGALPGAVRHAVPEVARGERDNGDAEAGFLLVFRGAERG